MSDKAWVEFMAAELGMDPESDWRDLGNCVRMGVDPETMQPETATAEEVEQAKGVCGGCPVRTQCKTFALDQGGAYGIWGGEWFGHPPAGAERGECSWCGSPMPPARRGGRFCGATCRMRAHRERQKVTA